MTVSRAHLFLHERTFLYYLRRLSNVQTSARRPRTIIIRAGLVSIMCKPLPLHADYLIHQDAEWICLLIFRDSRGPFFPRADLLFHERTFRYCLRSVRAGGQYSIKHTDLCTSRADLFR
jgi:hypothetical protein